MTDLRIAQNPGDYQRARVLIRRESVVLNHTLKFPTILAINEGDVVGVVGTTIQNKMIIAGPLAIDSSQRRVFTALRLMEAYDTAMRNIGVRTYILPVEQGSLLGKIVERYYKDVTPYAGNGNVMFYTRRLDGSQEAAHGA